MRKKILLLVCVAAAASVSFAQTLSRDWNTTIGELRTNAFDDDLVHIDAAGNTYVTGIFTEDTSVGSAYLEQLGERTYLAKLNSAGTVQWAVALQGYVTPKQITTDSDGNIYIACICDGEEIILGSTDGANKTLTGNDAYGDQFNTIVAKYNADGVLKGSDIYLHDADDWMGMAKVEPVGLTVQNNTVYLALSVAGDVEVGNTT